MCKLSWMYFKSLLFRQVLNSSMTCDLPNKLMTKATRSEFSRTKICSSVIHQWVRSGAIWSFNLSTDLNNDLNILEEQLAKQEKGGKRNLYKILGLISPPIFSCMSQWAITWICTEISKQIPLQTHTTSQYIPSLIDPSEAGTVCLSEIKESRAAGTMNFLQTKPLIFCATPARADLPRRNRHSKSATCWAQSEEPSRQEQRPREGNCSAKSQKKKIV